MSGTYLTLTDLGKLYGASSHQIGKWLKQVGLRTTANKPSTKAFKEGYVEQRGSTQPGTYIWIWSAEKTRQALSEVGHKQMANTEPNSSEAG